MTPAETTSVASSRLVVPPFEVWVAVAAVYTGLSYFVPLPVSGNARAVAAAFPLLAGVWSALYAVGGVAIVAGLVRRSPRIEGLGVCLLASGLTVATLAAVVAGAAVLPTVVLSGGAIVACVARLDALRKLP